MQIHLIIVPSDGGTYTSGQTATVEAQTVSGYTFDKWTESGSTVSTSASYQCTVNGNRDLMAVYNVEVTTPPPGTIPEFPTVALPIISVIALMFFVMRRKQN